MKELFIYLWIFLNKIDLINLYFFGTCLFYYQTELDESHSCWYCSDLLTGEIRPGSDYCLCCDIYTVNQNAYNGCEKILRCVSLIFSNETVFERFFQQYPTLIDDLLKYPTNRTMRKILHLTFRSYDLENVTFQYLSPILNSDSSTYSTLVINLISPRSNHSFTSMTKNFLNPFVNITSLRFSCNRVFNDTKWIQYTITPMRNNFHINKSCSPSAKPKTIKTQ